MNTYYNENKNLMLNHVNLSFESMLWKFQISMENCGKSLQNFHAISTLISSFIYHLANIHALSSFTTIINDKFHIEFVQFFWFKGEKFVRSG